MRKLQLLMATAVLLMGSTATASAQGFLKGLADKAKQKVKEKIEQKVERTVDDTMDGVLDGKGKSAKAKTTKAGSAKAGSAKDNVGTYGKHKGYTSTAKGIDDADEDIFQRYVAELAAPEDPGDVCSPYTSNEVEADAMAFRTLADAIKAFPPLPTAEQMIRQDTAPVKALIGFAGGVLNLSGEIIMNTNAATAQAKAKKQGGNAQMNGGAAQILAYMQQHGIDPDKMSDEQMAAMQQAIASGELKIDAAGGGGAFAIDPGYSEEMDAAIDRVQEKVDAITEKITATMETEQAFSSNAFGLDKQLKSLYAEIQAAWLNSDACKKVKDIEQDIDKRAGEYFKQQPDYGASGIELPYPDFWVEGRKQQNDIIRGFNTAQAEKWRSVLQPIYDKYLPTVKEIATVESELEDLFTDKMDLIYCMMKQHLSTALVQWSNMYQLLLNRSYNAPLVSEVAEE